MKLWLPDMDLNHDKQIQSLLCYRYTIGQSARGKRMPFPSPVKPRRDAALLALDSRPSTRGCC